MPLRDPASSAVKLLACDLDGTLLGPGGSGLETAGEVVRYCRRKGVRFTIATGRAFGAVERYLSHLGVTGPVIASGGAFVGALSGEPLLERVIDPKTAGGIVRYLRRKGLPFYFIAGTRMFTERAGSETARYSEILSFDIEVVPSLTDLGLAPGVVAIRIPPADGPRLLRGVRSRWGSQVTALLSLPQLVEVKAKGVSKAGALAFLAGSMGIAREEVLAVGDGLNDLDMLAWAGRSACVGNACPEVAAGAHVMAEAPFAEGVLEILKKMI